jgi:hypothetical protein
MFSLQIRALRHYQSAAIVTKAQRPGKDGGTHRCDPPAEVTMSDDTISIQQISDRVEQLRDVQRPRYRRLWAYCRNPMRPCGASAQSSSDRPYRQAQEWGLPQRITGVRSTGDIFEGEVSDEIARKEVVIENDIGWRIETGVDYLFGKPLVLESAAADTDRRAIIGELLRQILAQNGGILLLQQLALLGSVYGFVDVLVKLEPNDSTPACGTRDLGQPPAHQESHPDGAGPSEGDAGDGEASHPAGLAPRTEGSDAGQSDSGQSGLDLSAARAASDKDSRSALMARLARMVRLEIVEPARALPFVKCLDYREVVAYGQCWEMEGASAPIREAASGKMGWFERFRRMATGRAPSMRTDDRDVVVELITPTHWTRYENDKLVAEGENSLGRIPLVHIQNSPVPFEYGGSSDVEPLIPLQDELNTRLSDRASRITLQSFKMYLGKGIEDFTSMPVSPGRMWTSDNDRADVIEFGGDSSCPSEDAHISDMREAMDKTSGVTPIAAGAIKGRIGNLTSAAALRITLQALLAKTEKKRTTYGTAIQQICELALAWLDRAGLFATTPDERQIELNWPSPLPENELEKLAEAQAKARLGVPKEIVLRELGY